MSEFTVVVRDKGETVIPIKLREKMNIKQGTPLHVELRDDTIILSHYSKKK